VAEKTAHNPALRYAVTDRGFIREGYFADLVLIDPQSSTLATHQNSLYQCGWTPFDAHRFQSKIASTWVNGQRVYDGTDVMPLTNNAMALEFNR